LEEKQTDTQRNGGKKNPTPATAVDVGNESELNAHTRLKIEKT